VLELRAVAAPETDRALVPPMTWDLWRFGSSKEPPGSDPWRFAIADGTPLRIRAWEPGDRLSIRHGGGLIKRKVKYFLSDAGISGHVRGRWPVVVDGDEIAWIPGVRRSDAAAARSGGPVVTYVCDYLDRRS
jgi:tRNA(Ile)-lysidine synthetase-like protein